ncbi:MAG: glycosyltransferase [Actinomycetaceae bacterium]|nr:glycosyltransferase [Arcanobacterium sp.]MDD7505086.1 glycosyltransferase [Actinomycetaceae bacterium]MDY6142603.1 glycosyltransferase [Arcanobacterium sp.]
MDSEKQTQASRSADGSAQAKVAVVIPAMNEEERIGATVQAAAHIPHVDLVVVVDDGSSDDTFHVAQTAGAIVVRHSANRGKAAAMETGGEVVKMRDIREGRFTASPRALLFLDADLGESAIECSPLVDPVFDGAVDCTIAYLPPQKGAGGHGFVTGLGKKAIVEATGWEPQQPLSGQRCITREAFERVLPLASGWGVEVGMTIDLLVAGFTVQEVPCSLRHRASANDFAGQLHRAKQYAGVWKAVMARKLRKVHVPMEKRSGAGTAPGLPFNALAR